MKRCLYTVFAVLTISLVISSNLTLGGIDRIKGEDLKFWEECIIVYGTVIAVREEGPRERIVSIEPNATIAGILDPTKDRKIEARTWAGPIGSAIIRMPKPDEKIVCLLLRPKSEYIIPADNVAFTASKTAILFVEGFDDKQVTDLIAKVHKMRAEAEERHEKAKKVREENEKGPVDF